MKSILTALALLLVTSLASCAGFSSKAGYLDPAKLAAVGPLMADLEAYYLADPTLDPWDKAERLDSARILAHVIANGVRLQAGDELLPLPAPTDPLALETAEGE
jgi:hypothetical protein